MIKLDLKTVREIAERNVSAGSKQAYSVAGKLANGCGTAWTTALPIARTVVDGGIVVLRKVAPVAKAVVDGSSKVSKSKYTKRLATGAVAGGAIAYTIPFLAITTGAIFGAGIILGLKSVKDPAD